MNNKIDGNTISISDIQQAAERIVGWAQQTPVLTSHGLDQMVGASLYFKCENFQRTGSFKMRGASNAILQLPNDASHRGVVTHSSGNHASALACAAQKRHIPAYIVMPNNAPLAKRETAAGFGATIELCDPTMAAREATMQRIRDATNATLVHPYDDLAVIAGQGTAALEFLVQVSDLDHIIAPVSGGGLLSGTAIAAKGTRPSIVVTGAEPKLADDAARSFRSGKLEPLLASHTIADGLRASLCQRTLDILRKNVDSIETVSEEHIILATKLIWRYLKIVVEPSGAVPFALALSQSQRFTGCRVGLVLSGGNLDLERLPWQQ